MNTEKENQFKGLRRNMDDLVLASEGLIGLGILISECGNSAPGLGALVEFIGIKTQELRNQMAEQLEPICKEIGVETINR